MARKTDEHVGIQGRADKLMLLIDVTYDFHTENSRKLSKFGPFSEVDLR